MILLGQHVDDISLCERDSLMLRKQNFNQLLVFLPELGDSPQLKFDCIHESSMNSSAVYNLINFAYHQQQTKRCEG